MHDTKQNQSINQNDKLKVKIMKTKSFYLTISMYKTYLVSMNKLLS
jgi:hypothetical protein